MFAKVLLPKYMSAESLALVKVVIGGLFLVSIALLLKGWRVAKEDIPRFAAIGVFGIACSQILFYEGLALTSPIDAAIITSFSPALVIILSAVIFSDKITLIKIIGTILGISGAIIAIVGSRDSAVSSHDDILGKIYICIGTLFTSLYIIWSKPLIRKYDSMVVVGWLFAFAAIVMAVYVGKDATTIDLSAFDSKAYLALGFVVVGSTVISFSFRAFSLRFMEPASVSSYGYIKPVVATVAAIIIGQDHLTVTRVIAIILVVSSIVFTNVKSYRLEKPREHELDNGT